MSKRKFTPQQMQSWAVAKRQENYAAAEKKPLPSLQRRERELSTIAEFIKKRGVKRLPSHKEID